MKKELNVALYESCIEEGKVYGIIDKKIDGHLFDPSENIKGDNYAFEAYEEVADGLYRDQKDYYINLYTGILVDKIQHICSKQNVDVNEIEKISIYTGYDYDLAKVYYLNYIVFTCAILGIKYLDWYQEAPKDPKGYYKYKINIENYKSKTKIYLELIKGCSEKEDLDGILFSDEINTEDYDELFDIVFKRYEFIFHMMHHLTFIPDYPDYTNYLYIPENIYKYITEFGIASSILSSFVLDATGNKLFICCKDKITEIEVDDQLFVYCGRRK